LHDVLLRFSKYAVQALMMHFLGRRPNEHAQKATVCDVRSRIVAYFFDDPSSCLSIHSICAAGAKYGLLPGRWMGPYAIARAVADVASQSLSFFLRIVTVDSGGGAPFLDPERCAF
jgi:hypothetical protein